MKKKDFIRINPGIADWQAVYEVVRESGKSHNPRSFAIDLLNHLSRICPFDSAVAFFLDQNKAVIGHEQIQADEFYRNIYEEYKQYIDEKPSEIFPRVDEDPTIPVINVHNWKEEREKGTVISFVEPSMVKYSCGFALFDLNGKYRTIFSLDRHTERPFSNRELYNLQLALLVLNNLHKNFYYRESQLDSMSQAFWTEANLTAREIEVVDLLIQGIAPQEIARILYISMSTTYKHITHIYNKMHVTSRQELMVKLLAT